jgi:hypothetical protein
MRRFSHCTKKQLNKMKRLFPLLLTYLTLLSCNYTRVQQEVKSGNISGNSRLKFNYDKRVETVYFVLMLTGDYDILISRHPSSYKSAVSKYFSKYKDHKAVVYAKRLISAGFGFDFAANWIFKFSDFPEFLEINNVNFPFSELKINADTLELFRNSLTAFYKESNCDSFFTSQKDFLNEMISNTENSFSRKDLPEIIAGYYGNKKEADFFVVLSPLLNSGGYGIDCDNKVRNKKELTALIGPNGEIDFIPVFDKTFLEQDLIIHEFGHSFANEIVDQYSGLINKYENSLFPSIKENLENEGIGKESFMYELLVRAVTIRIVEITYGKTAADKLLEYEMSIGFKYVKDVADELKNYETQRNKYPTLKDFFPEIVNRLVKIKI